MINSPTQSIIAIQQLQKWVEKVAANANTAELDSLELVQLQRLLATIMGTYKGDVKFVSVPSTGFHITDSYVGTLNLLVPVTKIDGNLIVPPITIDAWFEHKLKINLQFIPFSGMTMSEATMVTYGIVTSIMPGAETSYKDSLVKKYLDEIKDLPYVFGFTFLIDGDFNLTNSSFDVKMHTGLPKVEVPGIGFMSITNETAEGADLSTGYLFDGTATEVGYEVGATTEDVVEYAAVGVATPFAVTITGLNASTAYLVTPYVKFGGKTQRGLTLQFTTLSE